MEDNPSIEELILSGVIEVSAVDSETGEFLYTFTDKLKELLPELYAIHINHIHNEIMYFWEKGLVYIDDITSNNPSISLTEKSFDEEALSQLSPSKRESLEEIKRILKVI